MAKKELEQQLFSDVQRMQTLLAAIRQDVRSLREKNPDKDLRIELDVIRQHCDNATASFSRMLAAAGFLLKNGGRQ